MIYCVVPPELEEEIYAKLLEYYRDNPNVEVIIDRRTGPTAGTARPPGERASGARRATAAAPARAGTFPRPTSTIPDRRSRR